MLLPPLSPHDGAVRRRGKGRLLFFIVSLATTITASHQFPNDVFRSAQRSTVARLKRRIIDINRANIFNFSTPRHITAQYVLPTASLLHRTKSNSLVVRMPRGGSMAGDEAKNDAEEEDWEEDNDEYMEDDITFDFEDNLTESDFAEITIFDRIVSSWQKTPPLTKGYLTASAAVSIFGFLFNKNQFPDILLLDWKKALMRLQVWRPFTSFLNFGPFGLSFLLTTQFVWAYMSTLERLSHSRPYDFWIMILFGQLAMVVGYPVLRLSPRFLGHNLSTYLVYIWSRYHEGVEVNMFELFNTRAELLPWFFLAQTFLLEGEPPLLDFLGIVFGHIYHHCKSIGILRAPAALTTWYEESQAAEGIREQYKAISSDFGAM